MFTLTVSQLNRYIKAVLDADEKLSDIYIRGEISNFVNHYRSGHFYFSLKDEKSGVRAVMFQANASLLRFVPENGMSVLVQANVSVYERDGTYQLYVTDMQPDGAGALAVAFEQLKQKLTAEGLFDQERKKNLPSFPTVIGIVTSPTGAVLQDMTQVLSRRWPLAQVLLAPAQVQGADAQEQLVRGLKSLDKRCDVIIIGRGGGSAEDLQAFNSEALARAISAMHTTVVSAVGHETDYSICDFVADVRAPTPSVAAELVVPNQVNVQRWLAVGRQRLRQAMTRQLEEQETELDRLAAHSAFFSPQYFFVKKREKLDFFAQKLYNNRQLLFHNKEQMMVRRAELLEKLSPLRVLSRGYAAVFDQQRPVVSVEHIELGAEVDIRLRDGTLRAEVTQIKREDEEHGCEEKNEL